MAVGDEITISDGAGCDYICRLAKIRDEECVAEVVSTGAALGEPPVEITLFMAMPKGDKLETIVQKAVELGVSAVVPFESERCIKRPSGDKIEKLTARLSRIALEAAKQCGRSVIPMVAPMVRLPDVCEQLSEFDLAIFCYEGEKEKSLKNAIEAATGAKKICVIVGSEGGFSSREAESLSRAGAVAVTLGGRILRCETAPDYVLSVLSYYYEM
jgi:16S rRNA (uracil1498-N3)-methyltransferase